MKIWIRESFILILTVGAFACKEIKPIKEPSLKQIPADYPTKTDTTNVGKISWRDYFNDKNITALIDTALQNNQELKIALYEIDVLKNEVRARKGEYLPSANMGLAAGMDKVGRYTRFGALEENVEVKPDKKFPSPLGDVGVGMLFNWEVDIWKRLRNARKAAALRYLSGVEGRNLIITNLIAEIAQTYYELQALDNMRSIVDRNVEIQTNALRVVRQQKDAAKVTQLAVNRFEAQLLNTRNLQFAIRQRYTELENRLRFLTGRYDGPLSIDTDQFINTPVGNLLAGVPSQLLSNRPDIRRAELELRAARIDVAVARAFFYPSLSIRAGMGFQAFNPAFLLNPESLMYNLAGDLLAPAINRNAIKANFLSANARQLQALYRYEQTLLNAYLDVLNQLARAQNFSQSFDTKSQEVELLNQSVNIANSLFNSARADYSEVLLTQREALEARMQLVEIKLQQLQAKVQLYRALGGGWQ